MKKINLQNPKSEVTFEKAFEEFIFFKKATNLSSESIKYYNLCYGYFCGFFSSDNPCNSITQKTILEYTNYLRITKPDISPVTINSYLRAIRAILYYCMELGYLDRFKINMIKAEKKVKETYTEDELKLLLKKPDLKTCSFSEYRDWVIINYFIGTGNRLSTVINILIGNIDFNNNSIILEKTKNRKQQIIPLSNTLSEILREYLRYRKGNTNDYLFCNYTGTQLSKYSLQDNIRKYNRSRGVNKTSIHLFRHTFAKMWILNGGDIFRLQKLLGHSTIDIVKEYVNMFDSDLQKDYDVFNPLENLTFTNKRNNKIKMVK